PSLPRLLRTNGPLAVARPLPRDIACSSRRGERLERGKGMMKDGVARLRSPKLSLLVGAALLSALLAGIQARQAQSAPRSSGVRGPTITQATAFDVSRPARELAKTAPSTNRKGGEVRPERGPVVRDRGHTTDGARQSKVDS